jgi:hypothetical protein
MVPLNDPIMTPNTSILGTSLQHGTHYIHTSTSTYTSWYIPWYTLHRVWGYIGCIWGIHHTVVVGIYMVWVPIPSVWGYIRGIRDGTYHPIRYPLCMNTLDSVYRIRLLKVAFAPLHP